MSREMKNSGIPWIGEIPSHWKVMPHKWVMHKEKDIKERYEGETILSLTMRGVIIRDLDAGGKMPITFDGYQQVFPDDLLQCLFDIDVTPRCVGLVKNAGLASPAYSRFVMHPIAFSAYYDYLLRYMDDNKVLLHLSKNLRSSLTETDFGAIDTCVPSLTEQRSIADFLDKKCGEIDEMISLQEKIVEELKSYKQSVITEAVTKGLNPNVPMKESGIEWIGKMPEDWSALKTLFVLEMPITDGPHTTPDLYETGIPFVSAEAVSCGNGGIDFSHIRGFISKEFYDECCLKYVPQRGDVYMIKSGATTGRVSIVDTDRVFTIWSPLAVFRANRNIVLPRYLFYSIQGDYYQEQVRVNWTFGTQQNIGMRTLETLIIALPPLQEQQSIADYLDTKCAEIDTLISLKQSKIEALKEYQKSIIYEYVTGKKEITI